MIRKVFNLFICSLLIITFSSFYVVEAKKNVRTQQTGTDECLLITGSEINEKIMNLAGTETAQILTGSTVTQNSTVKAIKRSSTKPLNKKVINISTSTTKPVYMWFESDIGTIYWYSETVNPIMNSNSTKLFSNLVGLEDISGVADFDASRITSTSYMFERCFHLIDLKGVDTWKTTNLQSMSCTFFRYYEDDDPNYKMTNLNALANWDVSKVTNMTTAFYGLQYITSLEALKNWDTSNVQYMGYAFMHLHNLESLNGLENWNTANVTNMYNIFSHLHIVTDISAVRNWNVSRVKDLGGAWRSCRQLVDISPLSNWNTSSVNIMGGDTYWGGVFSYDGNITDFSPIANWNTSNVTNMGCLFQGCSKMPDLQPFTSWNVSKVEYFNQMFRGCSLIKDATQINNWKIQAGTNFTNMFNDNLQSYPQWTDGAWNGGTFERKTENTVVVENNVDVNQTENNNNTTVNTEVKYKYTLDLNNKTLKDEKGNIVQINNNVIKKALSQKKMNNAINVLKKGGITVTGKNTENKILILECKTKL